MCCLDLIYYIRNLSNGGRIPAKDWRPLAVLLFVIVLRKFLDKYFPADVRNHRKIEFLELKWGNMLLTMQPSLKSCSGSFFTIMV